MPQSIFEHMAIDFTIKINVKQINDNDLNLPLGLLKYHTVDSSMTMLPNYFVVSETECFGTAIQSCTVVQRYMSISVEV